MGQTLRHGGLQRVVCGTAGVADIAHVVEARIDAWVPGAILGGIERLELRETIGLIGKACAGAGRSAGSVELMGS